MSVKPVWYRWARVFAVGGSIIGTGVLLYNYTVPTDEELISRFSPEVRAGYERNKELRQREQRELMRIVQKTAASSDPVWHTGPIKSPFEKDTRGIDPKLVDVDDFRRQTRNKAKQHELEQAMEEASQADELLKSQKKRWWSWK